MYVLCVSIYMWVQWLQSPEEEVRSLGTRDTGAYVLPGMDVGTKSGLKQEQAVFLTAELSV